MTKLLLPRLDAWLKSRMPRPSDLPNLEKRRATDYFRGMWVGIAIGCIAGIPIGMALLAHFR